MNKKVIFFHPNFSDGGVERTNLGLARGLINNGYKVTFLTTTYTNHFLTEIDELGIELNSLGNKPISKTIFNIVNYLNLLSKNESLIFISCQYYVNIISMIVSKLVKYRHHITFINSERNHFNEFKMNTGIKNFILPMLVRLTYKYADKIIANSQETAYDLSKLLNLPVAFVYNPTINERLLHLQHEPITEKWYLNDPRKTILGIGRFTKQKDFETLIKAYYEFGDHINYKLVILGDGQDREKLEKTIKKLQLSRDVYLPGFVNNPYKFLKKSSLFILTSQYEGLPNVLIESLYLKVPSISTNCKSGPKEILLNDKLLVNIGDYKTLAKKISYILEDDIRIATLFENAFESISRFHFENSIKSFIDVIKNEKN